MGVFRILATLLLEANYADHSIYRECKQGLQLVLHYFINACVANYITG